MSWLILVPAQSGQPPMEKKHANSEEQDRINQDEVCHPSHAEASYHLQSAAEQRESKYPDGTERSRLCAPIEQQTDYPREVTTPEMHPTLRVSPAVLLFK
jgi:hypothetical protein